MRVMTLPAAVLSTLALLDHASARFVTPTSIARSEDIVCTASGASSIAAPDVYTNILQACHSVDGKTVPVDKTFYFWDAPVDNKTLVYHIHNACHVDDIIEEGRCELKMDSVVNTCKNVDGLFPGGFTNDSCVRWGITVAEDVHNIPVENDLARRASPSDVSCPTPGQHTISQDEFTTACRHVCKYLAGRVIQGHESLYTITSASAGQLEFSISSELDQSFTLDENTCLWEFLSMMSVCSTNTGNFSIGSVRDYGQVFSANIVFGGIRGGMASRVVSNSTSCFPGNASVPITEMTKLVDTSICPIFVNATLYPKDFYRFDFYVPEGDLVFGMLNICDQPVTVDNDTCICGFEKVAETCTTKGDRFVNGTVDSGCIRLNTWVNATRLAFIQPNTTSDESKELIGRADPNNCPPGAKSPYPADITSDVDNSILNFCAQFAGYLAPASVTINRAVALGKYPDSGPVYFIFHNRCPVSQLFSVNDCVAVLHGNVQASYNACLFISASGNGPTHPCQHFEMLVGNI